MAKEQIEYEYPVEELDRIIELRAKGITPVGITPELLKNVELRIMELKQDDDDFDDMQEEEFNKRKQEMIQERINKKRREAHKRDIIIIKLTDEQKKTLEEEMSTSIVRCNPNSPYNKSDEELFDDDEKRVLYTKLARIKNCYYNQADYVAAIKVIYDAIEYSLSHDYPWMSKQEAIQAFNKGEIKFTFCKIPKLFINWSTQITDPQILKGVMTGEVTLQSKDESMEDMKKNKERNKHYNPVDYDYTITGEAEYAYLTEMQKRGFDTPLAPVLKMKAGRFNRFALPGNNRFTKQPEEQTVYNSFDWLRPGAGEEYYNLTHNIKYSSQDFIRDVNNMNNGQLNQTLGQNATAFLRDLKIAANGGTTNELPTYMQPLSVSKESAELEQGILRALKMNNPLL